MKALSSTSAIWKFSGRRFISSFANRVKLCSYKSLSSSMKSCLSLWHLRKALLLTPSWRLCLRTDGGMRLAAMYLSNLLLITWAHELPACPSKIPASRPEVCMKLPSVLASSHGVFEASWFESYDMQAWLRSSVIANSLLNSLAVKMQLTWKKDKEMWCDDMRRENIEN